MAKLLHHGKGKAVKAAARKAAERSASVMELSAPSGEMCFSALGERARAGFMV